MPICTSKKPAARASLARPKLGSCVHPGYNQQTVELSVKSLNQLCDVLCGASLGLGHCGISHVAAKGIDALTDGFVGLDCLADPHLRQLHHIRKGRIGESQS